MSSSHVDTYKEEAKKLIVWSYVLVCPESVKI